MAEAEEALPELPEEGEIDGDPFDLAAYTVLQQGGVDPEYPIFQFSFSDRGGSPRSSRIILIAVHQKRFLVAVPFDLWHRTASRRLLPEGALAKPLSLAVIAADPADRTAISPETELKVWFGFASAEVIDKVVAIGDEDAPDFNFGTSEAPCLPAASALEQAAKTRFSVQVEEETIPAAVGARFQKLEEDFGFIKNSLAELTKTLAGGSAPAVQPKRAPSSTRLRHSSRTARRVWFGRLGRPSQRRQRQSWGWTLQWWPQPSNRECPWISWKL